MDVGLLFPIAGAGISLVVFLAQAFGRSAAWRHAAHGSGVSNVREKQVLGLLTELRGQVDGFEVTLKSYHRGKHEHGTRVCVDGRGRIPLSLNLRAEGFGSGLDKAFGGKELEIGDPGFDREVYAQGPENELLPLLDDETRSAVRAAIALRAHVVDGTARIEVRTWSNANRIASALESALRVARRLQRPGDPVEPLVKIAGTDSHPTVRVRCLDLLRRDHAEDQRARAAFRDALRSDAAEVRLTGAIALGDEGQAALVDIASRPDVTDLLAARAISALGAKLPADRAASILDDAIQKGRSAVALAAVQALALTGGALAVSRLTALLTGHAARLAVAAAHALGAIGDSAAEAPLLPALESEDSDVRNAAAEALGLVGTAAAVVPLHAAADAHLLDLSLRSATRQAIAAIQARLTGAAPGQVSLAEGEGGRITLSHESDPGRLTIADK
jgi:hypothetical protein